MRPIVQAGRRPSGTSNRSHSPRSSSYRFTGGAPLQNCSERLASRTRALARPACSAEHRGCKDFAARKVGGHKPGAKDKVRGGALIGAARQPYCVWSAGLAGKDWRPPPTFLQTFCRPSCHFPGDDPAVRQFPPLGVAGIPMLEAQRASAQQVTHDDAGRIARREFLVHDSGDQLRLRHP